MLFLQKLLITTFIIGSSSGSSGGGSVNPNTPQNTGIFAQDYPNASADLNQVINDEATGQTYDINQRSLLSTDIISNDNDIAANQSAISANTAAIAALQSAAPNTHYHDVPAHTHSVGNHSHPTYQHHHITTSNTQTGSQIEVPSTQFGNTHSAGSASFTSGVAQTSGPAGSTAIGHSHTASDIPHTHDMGNINVAAHDHHTNSNGSVGNVANAYGSSYASTASAGSTGGAQ